MTPAENALLAFVNRATGHRTGGRASQFEPKWGTLHTLLTWTMNILKAFFLSSQIEIIQCHSEVECRVRVVSCLRLLLQQVVYGLLEWISQQRPDPELQPDQQVIQSLRAPADGSLVDALDAFLISCEQLGWAGSARILVHPIEDRPARRLCGESQNNVLGLLRSIVSLRNDGAEGHGLVGGYDREAELDALSFLIEILGQVLPTIGEDGKTAFIGHAHLKLQLKFIQGWNREPALIRQIKHLSAEKVRVKYQIGRGGAERSEFTLDTHNPFQGLEGKTLPSPSIWGNSWEPICYLPDKTTDSFAGRASQIEDLKDWMNDVESRACLIYGDGGYGKTTLALEFLHRMLEEDFKVEWHPQIVLYYTAKRWQWGLQGLEPVRAGQPHLIELLAFLHVLLFGSYPAASFYKSDTQSAAAQLQGRIKTELKLARNDLLIIIDNAETLIQTEDERILLGKELKEISKRVGRVLLTSRRHEHIEASPISVDVLSEKEALEFLRDRAKKLKINIVLKAQDSQILDAVQNLERRPIVLEAFVNALTDPAIKKFEQAYQRVAAMLQKDLGEFLFADAWARLNQDVRRLLLLMTRVGDVHDAQSLRICSDIVKVSAQSAERALGESGGIASVINVQGSLQITFTKNFLEFARDKTVKVSGTTNSPTDTEVSKAQSLYSAFIKQARQFTGDRIAQAFRTPQAKAAHRAREEGNIEECHRLYEAAIMTDSTNGWLFDRYAYFLFHDIHDKEAALYQAKRAVELLPQEGEAWHTRGVIEARLGEFRSCEISMTRAEEFGIPWIRCAVQRSWAYLKAKPSQLGLAESEMNKIKISLQTKANIRIQRELERLDGRLKYLQERQVNYRKK